MKQKINEKNNITLLYVQSLFFFRHSFKIILKIIENDYIF